MHPFDHIGQPVPQSKDSHVKSFVKGMHPLAMGEQTEFIDLGQGLCPGADVMFRRTLRRQIGHEFATKRTNLKEAIKRSA